MTLPFFLFGLASYLANLAAEESPGHAKVTARPSLGLSLGRTPITLGPMFTIEHDFDATVITLVDEGGPALQQDVIIEAFEDCITITQVDARSDAPLRLTLSLAQVADLAAALNLPEGSYRITRKTP